ncbi:cytochrome d ubiquinol oxidase subunit II [Streptomyces antibioticus]|uniref:cytochrome d ubiquinol oxidase subunit II n=1 Tax=Streptomyces antibioticus TaxID=1890 RepID=UPI00224DF999|nr:cytochrome d ubiquinol oxidase subunit II [Streptomyces antibioticus]MCX4743314.1 cytochrome d ubiquinol oxidase subunit II [Streptomyces antibioticus]
METLAVALLGFFFVGYVVLGGADLGLGMLLPCLGRTEEERHRTVSAIWPLFLVNEVWLVAAAGLFIGAFPTLEGEVFSGLLVVFVPLIAGWMIRDAGLWWRAAGMGPAADWLVCGGSWLAAGGWGWLIASLLNDSATEPTALGLGALTTLFVLLLFLAHGLGFATLRLTGTPLARAQRLTGRGGRGGRHSLLLTSLVSATLAVLAGARLPLTEHAAGDTALRLIVPLSLAALPLLLAAHLWLWRLVRRGGFRPSAL